MSEINRHLVSAAKSSAPSLVRRAYVAAVAALAVFLWGFAISRAIPERFTVDATIRIPASAKGMASASAEIPVVAAAALKRDLLAEDRVSDALRADGIVDGKTRGEAANSLVAGLYSRLQVVPRLGATPDELQFVVSFSDQNAARATTILNRLVGDYANRHAEHTAPSTVEFERAQRVVETARNKMSSVRAELAAFLERIPAEQPVVERIRPTITTPVVVQADPQNAELAEQLRSLVSRRTALLAKFTPQHPEVLQLDWQIADLQKQVDITIQMAPQSETNAQPEPRHAQPSKPAFSAEQRDDYVRLTQAVEEAQLQLDQAIQAERTAWENQVRAAPAGPPLVAYAAIPSRPDSDAREITLAITAVIAAITALVMGIAAGGIRATFASVAEAQSLLPVPIVGAITARGSALFAAGKRIVPKTVRLATVTCELSLALWLLAAVGLSVADRHFGTEMLRDPAAALSDAIGRLFS